MRGAAAALLAFLLAACQPAPDPAPPPRVPDFTLDSNGIQPNFTDLRIDFGRAQAGVIDTVSRLIGAGPEAVITETGCAAGPVTSARWHGGLSLGFSGGDFRGWTLSGGAIPVAGGLRVGLPRASLGSAQFIPTSRGTEFRQGRISGVLTIDGARVRMLWSGLSCLPG